MVDNTLVSPGYPNNYPDRMHCVYNVPISQGKALKIYFQMFDLEPSFSCG